MFKQLLLEWKSETWIRCPMQYSGGSRPPWGRIHKPEGKICCLNAEGTGALSTALNKSLQQQRKGGFQATFLPCTSLRTWISLGWWASSSGSASWMLKATNSRTAKWFMATKTRRSLASPAFPALLILTAGPWKTSRELQADQSHLSTQGDHGAGPPDNYAKAHGK